MSNIETKASLYVTLFCEGQCDFAQQIPGRGWAETCGMCRILSPEQVVTNLDGDGCSSAIVNGQPGIMTKHGFKITQTLNE